MRCSESKEHIKLKEIMKEKLMLWFKGIVLKEYMVAGYAADVYGITQNEKIIHAEIIWSPGQFEKNMISLLMSDAHVKVAVFGPNTRRFKREYNKVRIEQMKKGFAFTTPIEGDRLLANDSAYFQTIRRELIRIIENMPPIHTPSPRSYWYINEELVKSVIHSLGELNWKKYQVISQLALLDKKYTLDLRSVDNNYIGILKDDLEPTYIEDLNWSKTKKLLRFFGRFNAPFGVKEETITQFVLDPCYFKYKRPYSLNIHIKTEFIRYNPESDQLIGLDRWQKPSIFLIGLVRSLQPWQPLIIEPLVMYTSDAESRSFHLKLINETSMNRQETYFEIFSEKYGIEKATKLEEIIDEEIERILLENCWENQEKARDLESLYGAVNELVTKKTEVDALKKIVTFSYMQWSIEGIENVFVDSKLQLVEFKRTYNNILTKMLKELESSFDLDSLVSRELDFHDLILKILEKGKITIQGRPKASRFMFEVRVKLVLEKKSYNFTLTLVDDELKFLKDLAKKSMARANTSNC